MKAQTLTPSLSQEERFRRPPIRRVALHGVALGILSLISSPHPVSADNTPIHKEIHSMVEQQYDSLVQLYRHLHSNPELSYHEVRTAERLGKELESSGFQVTANFGGYGLVGVMKNGEGPTLMIRTDLDGLPVTEQTGLDYASRVRVKDDLGKEVGVMHACGHDIHMTCFVGTARLLSQMKNRWKGTLVMIGQPAEERGGGAKAMLSAGLYEKFPRPTYALALHDNAELEAGKIGLREGNVLAGTESVDLTIRGVSGHGAWAYRTKDPIVVAAQTIMALQTIVSREIPAIEPAVVTVGSIHGGTKHNIIPDEVQLQLTLRYYSDAIRMQLLQSVERIAKGTAEAAGVPKDREPIMKLVNSDSTPPTINDPELTKRVGRSIKAVLGTDNVVSVDPVMGGEDFSRFGKTSEKVPICIFWLGAVARERIQESLQEGGKPLPSLHSSLFAPVPEPTIKTGVTAMATAALDLLQK
jgi:amidohydrolase